MYPGYIISKFLAPVEKPTRETLLRDKALSAVKGPLSPFPTATGYLRNQLTYIAIAANDPTPCKGLGKSLAYKGSSANERERLRRYHDRNNLEDFSMKENAWVKAGIGVSSSIPRACKHSTRNHERQAC